MSKQTSIERLQEEYHKRGESLPSGVFQEAKEMHRKEIIDAWNSAGGGDAHTIGEQYYYSTFDVPKLGNEDVPKLGDDVKGGESETFKEEQKTLITEIMNKDAKDGLYDVREDDVEIVTNEQIGLKRCQKCKIK